MLLRHQLRVVQRQQARRPRLTWADRALIAEQNAAIAAYIRWYNNQAQPKVGFAASSPIRSWTSYPTKVA